MLTIAAIDIGSNAVRLVIAEFTESGKYRVLESIRAPVRLGADAFKQGWLSPSTLTKATESFLSFKQICKKHKVKIIRAVATSAMREARNSKVLIQRVKRATDIEISIVSGEEEAGLIATAVQSRIEFGSKAALLVDIGGGSVEITVIKRGQVIFSESVNVGTVRILNMMGKSANVPQIFEKQIRSIVARLKRNVATALDGLTISLCVGTGGNIEEFGNLRKNFLGKENNQDLSLRELDVLVKELKDVTSQDREKIFNLRSDRADVIVPAGIILQTILREIGARSIKIPGVGLKDGILLDTYRGSLTSEHHEPLHARSPQVIAFAEELGTHYRYEALHARHVRLLADRIFDQTQKLHRLNSTAHVLLDVAALLHDIGRFVSSQDHHKHSYYIIKETAFVGLSERQKLMVAAVVRYHRRTLPRMAHEAMKILQADERDVVEKLAGILRIADALDAQHTRAIKDVVIISSKKSLKLKLQGHSDISIEEKALNEKKNLFEKKFQLKLSCCR